MSYRIVVIVSLFVFLGTTACLAMGPFFGSWEVEIGLSPQQTMPFSAFSSTLDVGFRIGFLELKSSSDFIFSGWLWQELGAYASLGFISFDGVMLFEPQSGSFLYAQGMLELCLSPIVMKIYSAMVGPGHPGGINYGYVFDLYAELPGGLASFESATFLGADLSGISFTQISSQVTSSLLTKTYLVDPTIDGPCICFSGEELTFKLNFDCFELTSITTFACTGFEGQEFELSFLHLFGMPFNLTLDFFFSLQTASHTFIPSLETEYGCLSVYTDILQSGSTITGIDIYGIKFEMSFAGTTLRSISNLNTIQYVITIPEYGSIVEPLSEAIAEGHLFYPQDYWEIVSLVVEIPPGGGGLTFSVDTFFSTSTGLLFDWGRSDMGVTVGIGGFFSVTSGVVIDTSGFSEWRIGMALTW